MIVIGTNLWFGGQSVAMLGAALLQSGGSLRTSFVKPLYRTQAWEKL